MPRFRCRSCGKTFSRQTFRHDYRDRRPDLNVAVFKLLTSGVGLRQTARFTGLSKHGVQRKLRKLARTCARLHENLSRRLPAGRTYLLDEEESYEALSIRPLTVPVLIERDTWFIVAADAAPIRRLARRGSRRRARQDRDERGRGRRHDESRVCVRGVMRQLAQRVRGPFRLETDRKPSYVTLAREVFGGRAMHSRTSGRAVRSMRNPLFPINTTVAMTRDNNGRLRRNSWLVSKKCSWLRSQLALFIAYRNYVRKRFNRDQSEAASACHLGLIRRSLSPEELVRWRQDWGPRSIHPTSLVGATSVAMSA